MNQKFYDVLIAKEFEVTENGKQEIKTKWNRVGAAWNSKNGGSMLFELYLIPGSRYVINFKSNETKPITGTDLKFDEMSF